METWTASHYHQTEVADVSCAKWAALSFCVLLLLKCFGEKEHIYLREEIVVIVTRKNRLKFKFFLYNERKWKET